jgi:hypothetical protein
MKKKKKRTYRPNDGNHRLGTIRRCRPFFSVDPAVLSVELESMYHIKH